ncbi:MAG: prepilin-type N-terminal cleavage/methylation domain-containing protein [Candidatus Rokuibacteriota bacterium]
MHAVSRSKCRPKEAGFSLAEILVALAIISVGLIAVSAGFGYGVDGVEAGRQQSTAVFLAEQGIEQAKELAARKANLADLTHANLPAYENYGTISGAPPGYARATRICPGDAGCPALGMPGALVTVNVIYRPVTGRGVLTTERTVTLDIYFASR